MTTIGAVALVSWLATFTASADEESCANCGWPVDVSGTFAHYKADGNQTIQAAKAGDVSAFQEEIAGHNFTVSVPHLPAGKYEVIVGEVENHFHQPRQRLFDIKIGNQMVASNFDIFAAAGGAGKAVYLTNTVEHQDDSLGGPLTVAFEAQRNNAKFNTFEILDASGAMVVATKADNLANPLATAARKVPKVGEPEIWKDPSQPLEARVHDLVRRLSLAEKVQQIRNDTPAIPRLGIPSYNFWNEALHGVGRAGYATVFPQAIGLAATWDAPLVHAEADVISTEARAKHNEYVRTHNGNSAEYYGLTFWSPNINIFRDPRWGRGQETYGEDPFLTGTIGVAFIHGLQGDNPKYVKAMACAKHFAVHSGPEPLRHRFNANPPERDLYETYLPQFRMAVQEGHVNGFMGAYNALYGKPACADPFLLTDLLRKRWGFAGYIVSDCGAINDIYSHHKYAPTLEAAAADAVKAGCDICCGGDYNALLKAVQEGLITEKEINMAVGHALEARFELGLFDPPAMVPFSKITIADNDTPAHRALALKAACESIVLLKNDGVLPLNRQKLKRIAVIGANADSVPILLGNYNGTPSHPVTILDGIKAVAGTNIEVTCEKGCPLRGKNPPSEKLLADAVTAAKAADVVIYVGGINESFEREGHDRSNIELPAVQDDLLKALQATGKPVVFVNCSGSAVAMSWEAANLPAIVQAWYPGEEGGQAVAEVLFGEFNPAGRLPVTFYRSTADLPPFKDYSMKNRTYRYFDGKPLFAFGHGLSYTKFDYRKGKLDQTSIKSNGVVRLTFNLKNTGKLTGEEVVQVYFWHIHSTVPQPREALCGFERVKIAPGQTVPVKMEIPAERFQYWDVNRKKYVVETGDYQLLVGAASDDIRLKLPMKITAS